VEVVGRYRGVERIQGEEFERSVVRARKGM